MNVGMHIAIITAGKMGFEWMQCGNLLLGVLLVVVLGSGYWWKTSRKRLLPPGPPGWPVLGSLSLLGTKPHQSLCKLSKEYGPIMHLKLGTTDTVVASSPKVAREFLKTLDANFSNRPQNAGSKYMAYDSNDLVWAPYGPRWRMLRKVCNIHLFAGKALEDLHAVREGEVRLLVRSIADQRDAAVNLGELLNVCTANVLGQIMLSKRVFDSQGAQATEFRDMVVELMVLAGVFNIGDFVPCVAWMDLQGVQRKMKKLHQRFDDFFTRIIEEHRRMAAKGKFGERRDFLTVLLSLRNDADGEGGQLTDMDMKALLLDLFTAGTDTSSSTVEWAIAELIRHPEIMKRCCEEMDRVVGRDRMVKEADIPHLEYLQAVVKETMRLHPSTPLLLPRLTAEECEVAGYYIPKNARLLVNAWAIARDPDVWESPLEFKPGRFVSSPIDLRGTDFEVIPFGAGRRICAGMNMGIRMVQLMLATLLHSFQWSLPQGQHPSTLDMDEAYGLTLQRAVPLLACPSPRLPIHLYRA